MMVLSPCRWLLQVFAYRPVLLALLLPFLLTEPVLASVNISDSLLQVLPAQPDTVKVDIYNRLFWTTFYDDREQALQYATKGMELARETGSIRAQHGMAICLGHYYKESGAYEKDLEYKLEAIALSRKLTTFDEALSRFSLGESFRAQANYQLAMVFLREALNMAKTLQTDSGAWLVAKCQLETGLSYGQMQQLDSAEFILQNSLHVFDSLKNIASIGWGHLGLGEVYMKQARWTESQQQFQKAIYFFDVTENTQGMSSAYHQLGLLELGKEQYNKALQNFGRAVELAKLRNASDEEIYRLKLEQANAYLKWDKLDEALAVADSCLKQFGQEESSRVFIEANYLLSRIYRARKDNIKALWHADVSYEGELMRNQANARKEFKNLAIVYQAEQQQQINKILQQDIQLQEQNHRQNLFLGISAGGILLTLLVIWALLRQSQLNKKLVGSNSIIEKNRADLLHTNMALSSQNKKLQEINSEKDSIIKIITHDLKAPLDRIAGLVNLMKMGSKPQPDEQQEYLSKIEKVVHEGVHTIHRLLDYKALEEGRMELQQQQFSLQEFFTETTGRFSMAAHRKNITLKLEQPAEDLHFTSDRFYLARVVDNLVSNAIKFSFAGASVALRWFTDGQQLFIEVEDNGPGIKPEDIEKLFQKFQRLSTRPTAGESSTGLGLTIVKGITEKLGGEISYKPGEKHGACFVLAFQLVSLQQVSSRATS